ncbi:SDR family NAD(P)-dependent oxidoreductase [Spirosoma sp. HMF4905]|uniref:SDR family NAD(P)-dependent oxidoreductase n=1 Tax=Spirosoma arboris TaxID=2682092 RepID=A0A7K1S954_9BACT|nr:SDR family NAD(P)-dependent oxidoreductase [Spirosoma arboris]MVM30329.1 SDR family NAD(P)-dependent oxidoreductase [Spirosoma arboris]
MDTKKVWFVTGASKGLGLSLVSQLLAEGHSVAGTSRNADELRKAVGEEHAQFLPLQVDLANEQSVAQAVQKTHDTFKRIDVVVNNAGYGIGGSIEELTDQETRDSFDINVFGTLNIIRHVLPFLRAQQSGHIINISSIAGITANTGWAIYAATKYAVMGLSEVLADDVKSFGINVTVVAPGAFRTSFLSAESLLLAKHPIDAYEQVRASHAKYLNMDGVQAGDPAKAAAAMIQIANESNPPLYLLLGSDAYQRALNKIDLLGKAFTSQEELTKSTDF